MPALTPDTYRSLGKSSLKVSPICLGTMMFGGRADEAISASIIADARERGVNFIDTADQYCDGKSEEVIGRAIKGDRDWWVLATKAGNPGGKGPNDRGLGRRWLMQACENSLKRLDIDVIDIYYLHLEDHTTQLEETVSAIGTLMGEGMIHHFGVSNFRSWRIAEVVRLCDQMGIDRPIVSQPYYNAMNRQPEVEQLAVCAHYGMGVVPYSPLARGVLTGKYLPEAEPPADSRAAARDVRMMETEWRPESLEIAQKIKAYAEGRGTTPGRLAFAWVLNNRIVSSVLAGPRTMEQWTDYIAGLDLEFTAEDEAFMNEMVPAGHPSTYGYTDPRYPLEGRPTWTGA